MQRTVKIKLSQNKDLVDTLEISSIITQTINDVGNISRTYNKGKLHKLTYKKLRIAYPFFPSGLLQTSRDVASEQLKRNKLRKSNFNRYTSLRMDKRNLRINLEHKTISISSINGRIKIKFNQHKQLEKFSDWKPVAGTLSFKNNKLFLNIIVEKETQKLNLGSINTEKDIIGIDRGINNILVCSNNQFFNSKNLKRIKGKYQYLRSVLQKKGTKSAKRRLKKLSRKETRFVSDVNHNLSKMLAESDFKVFVLEDLKDMKKKKNGRKFNRKLGGWSFKQFEKYLDYKLEQKNKMLILVNPRYTSQTCSECSHKSKSNRKRSNFKCNICGYEIHSDLNASFNIAQLGKSFLSRLPVNQPIVTTKVSYKPTISMVGN